MGDLIPIPTGTYELGPQQATLRVRTGTAGAAARAGHNLLIEVRAWRATLRSAADPAATSVELTVDARSLAVLEGHGGMQALGEDDKTSIEQRIDDHILRGAAIAFRSTGAEPGADAGALLVHGELELLGARRPLTFELRYGDDGELHGRATVTQTDFGIKPYSALFGTLKVVDRVAIEFDGRLPAP